MQNINRENISDAEHISDKEFVSRITKTLII